jgi:hypothetical protein
MSSRAAAAATTTTVTPTSRVFNASVVVIGGGLAGLAATSRLASWFAKKKQSQIAATSANRIAVTVQTDNAHNCYYSDVLLVEASHRLGGRVHSVPWKDAAAAAANAPVLDMGATWFHGTRGNVAYDLAVANGMVNHRSSDLLEDYHRKDEEQENSHDETDYGIELFSNDGVYITNSGARHTLPAQEGIRIARLYAQALQTTTNTANTVTDSCWDHVKAFCGYDKKPKDRQEDDLRTWRRSRAILRSRDRFECCVVGCEGESTVDLSLCQDGYEWLLGEHVMPSHARRSAGHSGMSGLVHIYQQQIRAADEMMKSTKPITRILYNTQVNHIDWSLSSTDGKHFPELHTINPREPPNHQQQTSIIRASRIIWTPSINVTKWAIENQVFLPQLPPFKVQALHRRGQGSVEKVFVILAQPLHNVRPIVPLPVAWEEDDDDLTNPSSDSSEGTRHWKKSIYALTYDPNYQNTDQCVVSFWLSGSAGPYLNEVSESLRKQEVEAVLSLLFAQAVQANQILLSNWSGNPFVLGSYSYARKASSSLESMNSVEVLAEPLPSPENPVLCFAGEGTHPKYYSTMHGAIESGNREADRCIAYLQDRTEFAK